jgi:hypothetical protein
MDWLSATRLSPADRSKVIFWFRREPSRDTAFEQDFFQAGVFFNSLPERIKYEVDIFSAAQQAFHFSVEFVGVH